MLTNKHIGIFAAIFGTLAIASCNAPSEGEAVTTNGNVRVERLTQVDGCTIYRFRDGGRNHYTTICRQGATAQPASVHSSWTENCGENCTTTRVEQIDTVIRS
jgi:hypothetical protein